ncbi:posterior protein-like [Pyxicephalus adspersus]|uniref:posterior protein-like n=1 Tax=Pyxicephalus adspersus TaxID=30357 RepID=UPI003B5AB4E6
MDIVARFVQKYASTDYKSLAGDALTHQFNDLVVQCNEHNECLKSKPKSKKGKKIRMANVLRMLLRMKEISEEKEVQWYTERNQLKEQLENCHKNVSIVDPNGKPSECECEELKEEVYQLVECNNELHDRLDECEVRCRLREQSIAALEQKEAGKEHVIASLKKELEDSKTQLWQKEQDMLSWKAQTVSQVVNQCYDNRDAWAKLTQEQRDKMMMEQQPIFSADGPEGSPNQSSSLFTPVSDRVGQRVESLRMNSNSHSTTLSIQDRTNLCQILGKFETGASPISLSNRLEAVVAQYNLGNRDACALLRAWLPLQLCERLQPPVGSHKGLSAEMNSNWGNSADRMRELQRIMGGRDTRGTNALENTKFRRGDDPVLFCSEYLSLYKATYNCPDMSPDDSSFLYSMANKCTFVDYHTKLALKNASSYQTFINILRDWIQETSQDNRPYKKISEVVRSEMRVRFLGRCYRCGNTGHIMKECKMPKKLVGERKAANRKEYRHGSDRAMGEHNKVPKETLYGPISRELHSPQYKQKFLRKKK